MINILLEEYKALKSEQLARIKTRDTLLYISLSIFGAIFSYVLFGESSNDKSIVLLTIPTVSFILGWTYVANDEKISQIGRYIRIDLTPKIQKLIPITDNLDTTVFGWEPYHRSDPKRRARKILQVSVDLVAFIVPSIVSVVIYFFVLKPDDSTILLKYLTYWDMFLLGLTIWFVAYFDHSERRKDSRIEQETKK